MFSSKSTPLCITIGEIRLLQQEISSLTQRRKDFFLRAKTEQTKKSWRLSVFALSLVAALPLCVLTN
jgi:hypothetical protein